MHRTLIQDIGALTGERVSVFGWVDAVRDHGKLLFLVLRDRTGIVQCFIPGSHAQFTEAQQLSAESVVMLTGTVQERPEKNRSGEGLAAVELKVDSLEVFSSAATLPFTPSPDLQLTTLFDFRPLTLRYPSTTALFRLQAHIVRAFRTYLTERSFVEFQAPAIVGGDAEGGAEVFSIDYFDQKASLATSPQLYKQMLVGVFERVFCTTQVFRAEQHATARHLNEYTSLDFEMGFIQGQEEVMAMLEGGMRYIAGVVGSEGKEYMTLLGATLPQLPVDPFPVMKLKEAQQLLTEQYALPCLDEPDLSPEHERILSTHAKEHFGSDFLFITHYPSSKRPMYAHDAPDDPGYTNSFDLLFRGVEISSGGQRIHDYATLVAKMKQKLPGVDPERTFGFYLQAFKYGMPPHGGMAVGLERLTAKFAGLANAKEAALFPRDLNRIDTLLHEED